MDDVSSNVGEGSNVGVPARVKQTLTDTADNLKTRLSDGLSSVRGATDNSANPVPDGDTVRNRLNAPIPLSVGLIAVGALLGLVTPLSALERQRLKPLGESIARRAIAARDEIVDQSKSIVSETVLAAQESVHKHGQEIATSLGFTSESSGPAEHSAPSSL